MHVNRIAPVLLLADGEWLVYLLTTTIGLHKNTDPTHLLRQQQVENTANFSISNGRPLHHRHMIVMWGVLTALYSPHDSSFPHFTPHTPFHSHNLLILIHIPLCSNITHSKVSAGTNDWNYDVPMDFYVPSVPSHDPYFE